MSSFRIDRQYVSFVTAETRSVLKDAPPEGGRRSTVSARQEDAKLAEKARQEAEQILSKANAEASAAVKTAKSLAADILAEARGQAQSIREQARQAGFAEGQKDAMIQAEAQRERDAAQIARCTEGLRRQYSEQVESLREDMIALVMDITRKVIGVKLQESEQVFLDMVGGALERLNERGSAAIHVSGEDYKRYFICRKTGEPLHLEWENVLVVEQDSYEPGDLVVESDGELLDYSIEGQLERIEKAFTGEGG